MFSMSIFIINFLLMIILKLCDLTQPLIFVYVAIGVQTIAIFIDVLTAQNKMKLVSVQLLCGYLVRIVILFIDIYGKDLIKIPQSGGDSEMYYRNAVAVMESGGPPEKGGVFSTVMGKIFWLIGSNRIYAQFINIMISMIILYLIVKILIDLKINEKILNRAMWIICLFPTFTMLSAIFVREIFISFCVATSIFCFIRYLTHNNAITLVVSFGMILAGASIHAGVIALFGGYIIVLALYNNKEQSFNFNIVGVMFAIVLGLAFVFVTIQYSDTFLKKIQGVEDISDISNTSEAGDTSYAQYVGNSNNPVNLVIFTIPRIIFFLFSPLPFQWRGPVDAITFFCSSGFYFAGVYLGIKSIKHSKNKLYKSLIISLFIIATITLFVFGWGVANVGTALRHRDKLFSIFAVLLGIGWSAWYDSDTYKEKKLKGE